MAEVSGLDAVNRRQKLINEDPLKFVRFCTFIDVDVDVNHSKICIISTLYGFAYICIIHVFGAFNEHIHRAQIFSSLAVYSITSNFLLVFVSVNPVKALDNYIIQHFRLSNPEGPSAYQDLLRRNNWIKISHLSIVIPAVTTFLATSFTNVALHLLVPLQIIKQLKQFGWILQSMNSYFHFCIMLVQIMFFSIHVYMTFHIGAQFVVLQKFVIRKLYQRSDPYNPQQQDEISKLLREFVILHHKIKRISEEYSKLVKINVIPQITTGALNYSLCICLIVMGWLSRFPVIILVFLGEANCIFIAGKMGQIINDESSKLFDLMYACPWYDWDIRNRNTLLIILPNVVSPTTITVFNLLSVDNTLIIRFYRICYALITFLNNTI